MDYESDTLGGLMPQILALTAPPGTRDNRQPFQQPNSTAVASSQWNSLDNGQAKVNEGGLAAHPYFRRPGKGHNHDCCDACGEGGDLICCDSCPASFHLTCHDPPLDEEKLPTGEWACHQCRMGVVEAKPTINNNNINDNLKANKALKPGKKKEKNGDAKSKEENDRKVISGGREMVISDTPLSTLIKAVAVMNPTQFTLPYDMTLPANFPGEPKDNLVKKINSRKGVPKKKPYELDNGLVPLPAKLCFQCNKSCRIGPMIPCDYCPLFYHLDCLDPPLTIPPMGLWMCPNHPEHHMDTSLLTSHSLTERVKLWDKFSLPVDQNSVKLSFFHRCHRANPPFRYKVKKALRSRLRVPGSVKAHYSDPPDLLPHLSSSQLFPIPFSFEETNSSSFTTPILNTPSLPTLPNASYNPNTTKNSLPSLPDPVECNEMEDSAYDAPKLKGDNTEAVEIRAEVDTQEELFCEYSFNDVKPTQEEKDQWLTGLLSMQSSIIKHLTTQKGTISSKTADDSLDLRTKRTSNKHHSSMTEGLCPASERNKPKSRILLNGDLSDHTSKPSLQSDLDSSVAASQKHSLFSRSSKSNCSVSTNEKKCGKNYRNKLHSGSKRKKKSPTEILSNTLYGVEASLRQRIENNLDVHLSSLDQTVVDFLAYERLKQILEPKKPDVVLSTPPVAARALLCPLVPDICLKDFAPKENKYSSTPVSMCFRILNIGKGSSNHLNLDSYGHCNYVSSQHASISFDEATGRYELLNYSEFNTKVDGVTLHCDFSEKTLSQAASPPLLQQVKDIIAERRSLKEARCKSVSKAMNSRPAEDFVRCGCRRDENHLSDSVKNGWEGSAVLHHGSFIRFGCLKFVFSIVEEGSKGDWARDTLYVYDKFIVNESEEDDNKSDNEIDVNNDEDENKITRKDDSDNDRETDTTTRKTRRENSDKERDRENPRRSKRETDKEKEGELNKKSKKELNDKSKNEMVSKKQKKQDKESSDVNKKLKKERMKEKEVDFSSKKGKIEQGNDGKS